MRLEIRRWLPVVLLLAALPAWGDAVVLLYHHVGRDTPPSTSVTPRLFADHLDYLQQHHYQVVPLSRIVSAVRSGSPLPDRTVAITFDDGYRSVYRQAAPLLARHGYPFAVFVTTGYVDAGSGDFMTWDELRALEKQGAEIANHSRSHEHYVYRPPAESPAQWQRSIRADIQGAQQRLEDELDHPLHALAYPYGEFRPALTALAADLGFTAFGQQSGPIGAHSDPQALPRFPMTGAYGRVDQLAEKLRTRPFRVKVLAPDDAVLAADAGAPTLRLALQAPASRLDDLSCFVSGQDAPEVHWVDRPAGIVEVTARQPLPAGRSKYTCTAPARQGDDVYYWYSYLWMKPPAPGKWYED